jgi:hypothetical protein
VFAYHLAEQVAAVERALSDPDPWSGLRSYLVAISAMQANDQGLADTASPAVVLAALELPRAAGEEAGHPEKLRVGLSTHFYAGATPSAALFVHPSTTSTCGPREGPRSGGYLAGCVDQLATIGDP